MPDLQALRAAIAALECPYPGIVPFREGWECHRAQVLAIIDAAIGDRDEDERLDEHGEPLPPNCTGEGCSKCSGEYCERHFDKPCDCDVIDRHTPEDEDDFDISEEDLDATAEQSRPPQSWFDEKWELPLPTHAVDGEQQTNLL
jgi:hypothetical protein